MLLEGLFIPLTTPFHADGRLLPHKLAANVLRYSKSPAAGLIALAPHAGEPTLLSDAETTEVLRAIVEAAAPEKVLLAHISRDSVAATLAIANEAATLGYDAVLVGAPTILSAANAQEQANYFRTIADRSPLPIVLTSTARAALALNLVGELATHPNVLGLYSHDRNVNELLNQTRDLRRDVTVTPVFAAVTNRMLRAAAAADPNPPTAGLLSVASLARNPAAAATALAPPPATTSLKTRTKSVGFQIIAANPQYLLDALRSSATAIAPAFAACAPQACYEVYAAWKDNDEPLAAEKQHRIEAAALFAEAHGPAALKFGCDLNGYYGGPARLPWLPLSGSDRAELQQHMQSLRT